MCFLILPQQEIPIPPLSRTLNYYKNTIQSTENRQSKRAMNNDQIPSLDIRKLKVLAPLGRGARGVVFLVRDESSNGELFALKTILKSSIAKSVEKIDHENFIEHEVLGLLQHPLLPKLRGVLSTDNIVGYAIDYCCGRDLNCLRKKQTERMFSDDVIR